jgi:murein tripeptide amidase MpaA
MPPYPTRYLRTEAINAELARLARDHPTLCRIGALPSPSWHGRVPNYLHISSSPAGPEKTAVVIIAGQHAREWAPPEALWRFAEHLLIGYANNLPANAGAYTLPAACVKLMVDALDIYIAPVLNPDGRNHSLRRWNHRWWRKNRNRLGGGNIGVDLNRNHDLLWNFPTHYTAAAAATVRSSQNPADDTYIGPAATSEPETQNVHWLVRNHNAKVFFDLHSYAGLILHPWGIETSQTTNPAQNYANAAWSGAPNGSRDARLGLAYQEYIPPNPLAAHARIGGVMKAAIAAATGSNYTVQAACQLYPASGTACDFIYALARDVMLSFTLECGLSGAGSSGGGFHPDIQNQFPNVKHEIWAALYAALDDIVRGTTSGTPPHLAPPAAGAGGAAPPAGGAPPGGGAAPPPAPGAAPGGAAPPAGPGAAPPNPPPAGPPFAYAYSSLAAINPLLAAFLPHSLASLPLTLLPGAGPPTPLVAPTPTISLAPPAPSASTYTGPPVHAMRLTPTTASQGQTVHGLLLDQSLDFTAINAGQFRIQLTFSWGAPGYGGYITAIVQRFRFLAPRELEFEVPPIQPTPGGVPPGVYTAEFLYWPSAWRVLGEQQLRLI